MELIEPSLSLYESVHASYFFFIFIILILFLLLGLLSFTTLFIFLLLKRSKLSCKCEICHCYVTSSWSKKYQNICDWYTHLLQISPSKTIHIHVLDNIITASPKNVEYILKTNFNNYPKGKHFSTILGDLLGHGIFNVDGDAWKFQRKMASLELDRFSVRSYSFQVVKEEIDKQLIPYLYAKLSNHVVDLQEIFRAFSLITISKISFGVNFEPLQELVGSSKGFSTSFDLATRLSAERALEVCSFSWKLKRLLGLGKEQKLRNAIKEVNLVAMKIIKQRRNKLNSTNDQDQKDLLSRFMKNGYNNNDGYLRDIIVSFLLAGRDTVASAITSLIMLIAHHPRVEEKILLEASKVLGQEQGICKYDQIVELNYLQATIFESMRLYPPVQFDSKYAENDDILPDMNTKVMKGSRVTYHPYAMGRMEMIWGKDCFEFKPERWLKNGVFFQHDCYKYPVFQAGVRVCLGKEMALMEIKCVAICLLREFHFELVHNNNDFCKVPRFSPGLTATFLGGLPVLLHARKNHTSHG
ncbi:unnamed protein product [Amaranthus hypochondriacus]